MTTYLQVLNDTLWSLLLIFIAFVLPYLLGWYRGEILNELWNRGEKFIFYSGYIVVFLWWGFWFVGLIYVMIKIDNKIRELTNL